MAWSESYKAKLYQSKPPAPIKKQQDEGHKSSIYDLYELSEGSSSASKYFSAVSEANEDGPEWDPSRPQKRTTSMTSIEVPDDDPFAPRPDLRGPTDTDSQASSTLENDKKAKRSKQMRRKKSVAKKANKKGDSDKPRKEKSFAGKKGKKDKKDMPSKGKPKKSKAGLQGHKVQPPTRDPRKGFAARPDDKSEPVEHIRRKSDAVLGDIEDEVPKRKSRKNVAGMQDFEDQPQWGDNRNSITMAREGRAGLMRASLSNIPEGSEEGEPAWGPSPYRTAVEPYYEEEPTPLPQQPQRRSTRRLFPEEEAPGRKSSWRQFPEEEPPQPKSSWRQFPEEEPPQPKSSWRQFPEEEPPPRKSTWRQLPEEEPPQRKSSRRQFPEEEPSQRKSSWRQLPEEEPPQRKSTWRQFPEEEPPQRKSSRRQFPEEEPPQRKSTWRQFPEEEPPQRKSSWRQFPEEEPPQRKSTWRQFPEERKSTTGGYGHEEERFTRPPSKSIVVEDSSEEEPPMGISQTGYTWRQTPEEERPMRPQRRSTDMAEYGNGEEPPMRIPRKSAAWQTGVEGELPPRKSLTGSAWEADREEQAPSGKTRRGSAWNRDNEEEPPPRTQRKSSVWERDAGEEPRTRKQRKSSVWKHGDGAEVSKGHPRKTTPREGDAEQVRCIPVVQINSSVEFQDQNDKHSRYSPCTPPVKICLRLEPSDLDDAIDQVSKHDSEEEEESGAACSDSLSEDGCPTCSIKFPSGCRCILRKDHMKIDDLWMDLNNECQGCHCKRNHQKLSKTTGRKTNQHCSNSCVTHSVFPSMSQISGTQNDDGFFVYVIKQPTNGKSGKKNVSDNTSRLMRPTSFHQCSQVHKPHESKETKCRCCSKRSWPRRENRPCSALCMDRDFDRVRDAKSFSTKRKFLPTEHHGSSNYLFYKEKSRMRYTPDLNLGQRSNLSQFCNYRSTGRFGQHHNDAPFYSSTLDEGMISSRLYKTSGITEGSRLYSSAYTRSRRTSSKEFGNGRGSLSPKRVDSSSQTTPRLGTSYKRRLSNPFDVSSELTGRRTTVVDPDAGNNLKYIRRSNIAEKSVTFQRPQVSSVPEYQRQATTCLPQDTVSQQPQPIGRVVYSSKLVPDRPINCLQSDVIIQQQPQTYCFSPSAYPVQTYHEPVGFSGPLWPSKAPTPPPEDIDCAQSPPEQYTMCLPPSQNFPSSRSVMPYPYQPQFYQQPADVSQSLWTFQAASSSK